MNSILPHRSNASKWHAILLLTRNGVAAILLGCAGIAARAETRQLTVKETPITVGDRTASIVEIANSFDGGIPTFEKGTDFDVEVMNQLPVPTTLHWHGLVLPNSQDGVPYITQNPIPPGESMRYRFSLGQSGTYWMHSHYGLQEQLLQTAPLILLDPAKPEPGVQQVVVSFNDFSFTSPIDILRALQKGKTPAAVEKMRAMGMLRPWETGEIPAIGEEFTLPIAKPMKMAGDEPVPAAEVLTQDVRPGDEDALTGKRLPGLVGPHDVAYDALLANRRTLEDPEIVTVQPGGKVRLRLIAASSATNFFIKTGALKATAIAVDGQPIEPVGGDVFELAIAQRIDLMLTIPEKGGAFPILAQGEGTKQQAGVVLATPGAEIPKLPLLADVESGALTSGQEMLFHASDPLPDRPVDRKFELVLGGSMMTYIWTINGFAYPNAPPLVVKEGERVEITYRNTNPMGHPMHLHGHDFQIVAINGKPVNGPMRDTVFVPAEETVTIQFDADNPGIWALHCHILYHLATGMFTVLMYEGADTPYWKPALTPEELQNSLPEQAGKSG